jgi:hypothetical protein
MKYKRRLLFALVTFIVGTLCAAIWSAHLGKRLWSPRVFAWPNPLRRPPAIDLRPDSPLLISNPRYYSLMSIGSAIGGVLRFDVTNRSNKLIHSYDCRYYSPVPFGNGAYGSRPEEGVQPGESQEDAISAHEYAPLTLTIDFVQFADGATWFSDSPHSTVKPEGVKAGAKAAATYLLAVLNRDGIEAVMEALPRIHADVMEPGGTANEPDFGIFGFYCGVTNTAVRVEHEYKERGADGVKPLLRSYEQ